MEVKRAKADLDLLSLADSPENDGGKGECDRLMYMVHLQKEIKNVECLWGTPHFFNIQDAL